MKIAGVTPSISAAEALVRNERGSRALAALPEVVEEKCRAWPGIFLLASFSWTILRCDFSAAAAALPCGRIKLVYYCICHNRNAKMSARS
jgi:hypothetical protein